MPVPNSAASLLDKVAIVTGSATGIGRQTALTLAGHGARVVAAGQQPEELEETARLIRDAGGEAVAVETDVSDPDSVAALADRVAEDYGGTDVLVNNAAIYPYHPWTEADRDEWRRVLDVNVIGLFLCAQAVRPQMAQRAGGSIVNISSTSFIEAMPNVLSYATAKSAIIGFTRNLATEVGPEGIRVNAVLPGAQRTNATSMFDPDVLWPIVLERQAIKRDSRTEDVADVVAFFASDQSSFVTGQSLAVDGGIVRL
jgi:3-oxoacyl-[acyl-carrier protein] reductase